MLKTPKKVALMHGGPSHEHQISLSSAASVREALQDTWHETVDIYIDKKGAWHRDGVEKSIDRTLSGIDSVFIALHGTYGEDGQIQKILETYNLDFNGAASFSSRTAFNKALARSVFEKVGLRVPEGIVLNNVEDIEKFFPHGSFHDLDHKIVIKPALAGSSVGVTITDNFHEAKQSIHQTWHNHDGPLIVEEAIPGREFAVSIVEVADDRNYALPIVEIVDTGSSSFFDYGAKYSGQSKEACPADVGGDLESGLKEAAIKAHEALQARHYSRSDFMVTDDDQIYILETNTLPGLTKHSLFPKSLAAAGTSLQSFLLHII